MKAFSMIFFAPVVPRLLMLATTFCQPLLVNRMLEYVSNPDSSDGLGWALVGAFICVYGLMTLATAMYWEKVYALVVRFRGALVGCIYAKTLNLASHKSRSLGTGVGSTYMWVFVTSTTRPCAYGLCLGPSTSNVFPRESNSCTKSGLRSFPSQLPSLFSISRCVTSLF